MLDRYLRRNFGKFIELGEFKDDEAVEFAFKRFRMKRRALQIGLSLFLLIPVLLFGFFKYGGGKGPGKVRGIDEYYALGVRAFEEGRYEQAVDYFEEVVELGPEGEQELNTYIRLGDSFYIVTQADREETYRKSLENYQKALGAGTPEQREPNLPWIYYQMGNCQRNVHVYNVDNMLYGPYYEDYLSAIKYYDVVIRKYPMSAYSASSVYYKAACFRALEDFKTARQVYNQLCEQYPGHELAKEAFFDIADCFVEEAKVIGTQANLGTIDLKEVQAP